MDFSKQTGLPSAPESVQIAESGGQSQQLAPPRAPGYSQLTPPPPLTVHMAEIDGRQVPLTPPPPPPFQSKIFPPPPPLPPGYGYCYHTPRWKPFRPTLPPIPEDYVLLRFDEQNRTLKLAKVDQDEDQVHVDQHADQAQPRRKQTRGSISLMRRKILNTLKSFCSCY